MQRKNKSGVTRNQRIGNIGERQIMNALESYNWSPATIVPDIGEDILVRIQDDRSAPTGLDFYVQAKSAEEIKKHQRRNYLSRSVRIADLIQWEKKVLLVVLFGWDTALNQGYWISIPDAITELTKRKPAWRSSPNESITVRIPLQNTVEPHNLRRLHQLVALRHLPFTVKNRPWQLKVNFPPGNSEAHEKVQKLVVGHLRNGTPAEISGEFLNVELPDWLQDLFSGTEPIVTSLKLS